MTLQYNWQLPSSEVFWDIYKDTVSCDLRQKKIVLVNQPIEQGLLRRIQPGLWPRDQVWAVHARSQNWEHPYVIATDSQMGIYACPKARLKGSQTDRDIEKPKRMGVNF